VVQYFSESLLVAFISFLVALLAVQLMLPTFNQVADKRLTMPWGSGTFWVAGIVFSLFTGLIAGSYPALYLSSFNPVKVLKGTFRVGRFASLPRKVLVVVQFSVSVILIIGTVIVFRQIQFAKDRPIGYERNGLVQMFMITPELHKHFDAVRNELKSSGAILEMAESGSPPTQIWNTNGGFEWKGKDPALAVDFPNTSVTFDYGKTIGWQFVEGRDFSPEHATDSLAFVINQAAAKFLGFENPVGEVLKWDNKSYTIIGIIKDMIVESPYEPARASLFHISKDDGNVILMKLNPAKGSHESIEKIKAICEKFNPESPFEYQFVDQEYAQKFQGEERIGKLASFFAGLAIFISCLGIFGLASFVAEQRSKEIGVRKVLGASVFGLWKMLSGDFILLVLISFLLAVPISYFLMGGWLAKYQYRTEMAWWIFVAAGAGALIITLATVSYQSIKAAMANPVNSLRTE
jgi:ABC-type antimicrobial peptide transport system permease subunit